MGREYFDDMYSDGLDPWGFDDSWYEQRKFDISTAILPRPRYRRALEPGCSGGTLTRRLAQRCEEVVAFDFIESLVAHAQSRLADVDGVEVRVAHFPSWWPEGTGDLVVWSEIAYYLDVHGARRAIDGLANWLEPGGHLLAVHYLGDTNYPRTGASIARWLDRQSWLERRAGYRDVDFEAVVWERTADG